MSCTRRCGSWPSTETGPFPSNWCPSHYKIRLYKHALMILSLNINKKKVVSLHTIPSPATPCLLRYLLLARRVYSTQRQKRKDTEEISNMVPIERLSINVLLGSPPLLLIDDSDGGLIVSRTLKREDNGRSLCCAPRVATKRHSTSNNTYIINIHTSCIPTPFIHRIYYIIHQSQRSK